MKNFFTSVLFFVFIVSFNTTIQGQAAWEAPLKAQLDNLAALTQNDQLAGLSPAFERIAVANKKAWLPNYYAAHINLLQHWAAKGEGCSPCLEKVDNFLSLAEEVEPKNSEVLTLRASYYQAMLNMYPMRAPFYGPKAGNLLEAAMKADPNNPRAASLMGQNLYYTPSMFGGGADKAKPYLERSVKLFEAEAAVSSRNPLLPHWGAARAKAMLTTAVAAN